MHHTGMISHLETGSFSGRMCLHGDNMAAQLLQSDSISCYNPSEMVFYFPDGFNTFQIFILLPLRQLHTPVKLITGQREARFDWPRLDVCLPLGAKVELTSFFDI